MLSRIFVLVLTLTVTGTALAKKGGSAKQVCFDEGRALKNWMISCSGKIGTAHYSGDGIQPPKADVDRYCPCIGSQFAVIMLADAECDYYMVDYRLDRIAGFPEVVRACGGVP